MTTTTMDPSSTTPALASRKTPAPVTWEEHEAAVRVLRRPPPTLSLVDTAAASTSTGTTARGKPPSSAHLDRFVTQVMWCLFATAMLRVFGLDLLRLVWRALMW